MNTANPGYGWPENEFLGPGAIYVDYGLSTEWKLGVTKGGNSFNDNAEFSERNADNDTIPIKGARNLIFMRPQLKIKSLKFSVQSHQKFYAGSQAGTASAGIQKVYRTEDLSSSYLTNIAWVGKDENGNNMAVVLDNALGDGALSLEAMKKEKIVNDVTFTAHGDPATFDPEDKTTFPYHVEYQVSTLTVNVKDDAGTPANVEGATVVLDDGQTGTTDASGDAEFTVTYGKIGYTVSKTGYDTTSGSMTVDETTETLNVTLPAST